ncbi:hypothetical protein TNCV_4259511 [Trichonephila clavipes]|nr:hypothetical protein TNCV_4259511 [Trichonephila clavipes]
MPNHITFHRLHRQLRETGSFNVTRRDAGPQRAVHSPSLEESTLSVVSSRGYSQLVNGKFDCQTGNSTYSTDIHEQHSRGSFTTGYNAHLHTAFVPQPALQSFDMLPWPVRSTDISPIESLVDNSSIYHSQH